MHSMNFLVCLLAATIIGLGGFMPSRALGDEQQPEKTKTITAAIPAGRWLGWGTANTPGWANTPPRQGEVVVFDARPGEPRTFSGRVVGVEKFAGVEVGLVSLTGVYWVRDDTYVWQPVKADGTFLLTDHNYTDQNKCVVVRAPGRPWSFCEYIFKAPQCGRDMVLRCDEGRQVTLTARTVNAKDPADFYVTVFVLRKGWVHAGNQLGYQFAGNTASRDGKMTLALPAEPVGLYISAEGAASDWEILDPREADQFDIKLLRAGCIEGIVLRDGMQVPNTQVSLINMAAAFSLRIPRIDEHGLFMCGGLAPGKYSVSCEGVNMQADVREGETTQLIIKLPRLTP